MVRATARDPAGWMTLSPLSRAQARNSLVQARVLVASLRRPRYEILAVPGAVDEVSEHVPPEITVTVTTSPRRPIEATIETVEELVRAGYPAVPHLAARQVVDQMHLVDLLERLRSAGVTEVFVIAGDGDPVGTYPDSVALLAAMAELDHGLSRIGVGGYPEGHPKIDDVALGQALRAKAQHASYAVTQMCFDPGAVSAWVLRIRKDGIGLPVYVGLAGVVDRRRLLRIATRIGVGQSAHFLRRHRGSALRLAVPGAYRPDRLISALTDDLGRPGRGVVGLHLYTLGNVAATERWRRQMLQRFGVAERLQ